MADTGRRGATSAAIGASPGEAPSVIPDKLPFARAASIIAVILLAGAFSATTKASFQARSSESRKRSTSVTSRSRSSPVG